MCIRDRNRLVAPLIDCFAYRWMRNRYIDYRIAAEDVYKRQMYPHIESSIQFLRTTCDC